MRGRTGGMALAAITSIALVATACGGGGTEPEPGASQPGGQAGGEIAIAGLYAGEPADSGQHERACGGDIIDAMPAKLVHTTPRTPRRRTTSRSPSRPTTTRLFTVKLKPVQVPRRHRGQGQELRRCLELHRLRPERPGWTATSSSRSQGFADVQCARRKDVQCEASRKAKTMSGLKVVDDTPSPSRPRAGRPTCRCGWATPPSPRCRIPSSTTRRPSRRSRSAPGRSRSTSISNTEYRALQVRRLLRRIQGERGQADLPDLPGRRRGLRRRRGQQPRLHRRSNIPQRPARRRRCTRPTSPTATAQRESGRIAAI